MKSNASLLSCSLFALVLAACSPAPPAGDTAAGASASQQEGIEVTDAWIRQPPPSSEVAGGYLRIRNPGSAADRLVAVETAAAQRVEIHEMQELDGVMRMREIRGGLPVPAGGEVALEPGGYHLMLMGAREGLEAGGQVDGVLVFERAGRVQVGFEVRPPGAGGHGDGDTHDH